MQTEVYGLVNVNITVLISVYLFFMFNFQNLQSLWSVYCLFLCFQDKHHDAAHEIIETIR